MSSFPPHQAAHRRLELALRALLLPAQARVPRQPLLLGAYQV